MRIAILVSMLAAVATGGCRAAGDTSAPVVVVDPAVFSGQVEVTEDPRSGVGVLVSTATEEVLIAPGPVARALREHEGSRVTVTGRLFVEGPGAPTMVVRSFRLHGGLAGPRPPPPLPYEPMDGFAQARRA